MLAVVVAAVLVLAHATSLPRSARPQQCDRVDGYEPHYDYTSQSSYQ